jgi:site-specific recombinase XerC
MRCISPTAPASSAESGDGSRRQNTSDTRAIQLYLGHRNIQHTVLYTQLTADRFNDFWKD